MPHFLEPADTSDRLDYEAGCPERSDHYHRYQSGLLAPARPGGAGAERARDRVGRAMKHLLLSSATPGIRFLPSLLARETHGLRLLFIPTAAGSGWRNKDWVQRGRWELEILGCELTSFDLAEVEANEVEQALRDVDGIFLTGGNAYLLLWHARRSGFAELASPLVEKGRLVYAGTSAGALLAGPDIDPAASPGDRAEVPNLDSSLALGLTDFTVLPHDHEPERAARHDRITAAYPERRFIRLTDDRAVLVRGSMEEVIELPPATS
jgi:dipeptidase E